MKACYHFRMEVFDNNEKKTIQIFFTYDFNWNDDYGYVRFKRNNF